MVLVANQEEDLFANLDERLTSRLQTCVRVQFEHYRMDELVSILEARALWGLAEHVIDRPQLAMIADAAAGDVRIGIGILRNARIAHQEGVSAISDEIVHQAIPDGREEVRQKTAEKLRDHQRVLFEILKVEGGLSFTRDCRALGPNSGSIAS